MGRKSRAKAARRAAQARGASAEPDNSPRRSAPSQPTAIGNWWGGRRAAGRRTWRHTIRSSSESSQRAQTTRRHRSGRSRRDQTPPVGCASWPPARSGLNMRSRTRYAFSSTAATAGATSAALSACPGKEHASAINDASRPRPLPRMSRAESRRSSLELLDEPCEVLRPHSLWCQRLPGHPGGKRVGVTGKRFGTGVGDSGVQDSLHSPLTSGRSPAHRRA